MSLGGGAWRTRSVGLVVIKLRKLAVSTSNFVVNYDNILGILRFIKHSQRDYKCSILASRNPVESSSTEWRIHYYV